MPALNEWLTLVKRSPSVLYHTFTRKINRSYEQFATYASPIPPNRPCVPQSARHRLARAWSTKPSSEWKPTRNCRRAARCSARAPPTTPPRPHPTAFLTSALICACSASVSPRSAKATGHMSPSSRAAASLKPSVAYLVLNLLAAWKKHTTLPPLA